MFYYPQIRQQTMLWSFQKCTTLKRELRTAMSIIFMIRGQLYHMAAKICVFVDEEHSKLSTLYWLPKLHKCPYKSCFIAKSS